MNTLVKPIGEIAPSIRVTAESVQIPRDQFNALLHALLEDIPFDENWYLETYPDVSEAIMVGQMTSARQHFSEYGYVEGRLPIRPDVDEQSYLKAYPDVAKGVAQGLFKSAFDHYCKFGAAEGRQPRQDASNAGNIVAIAQQVRPARLGALKV